MKSLLRVKGIFGESSRVNYNRKRTPYSSKRFPKKIKMFKVTTIRLSCWILLAKVNCFDREVL